MLWRKRMGLSRTAGMIYDELREGCISARCVYDPIEVTQRQIGYSWLSGFDDGQGDDSMEIESQDD